MKTLMQEIEELRFRKRELDDRIKTIITQAIEEAVKDNEVNTRRIGNAIIINHSQIIGNPWNIEFYDYEKAGKIVMKELSNKAPEDWVKYLNSLLETKNKNRVDIRCKSGNTSYSIPIDKKFIINIINKLQK